jgi:hypothetical protein
MFFWTLEGGMGPYKAYQRRIPDPEIVTRTGGVTAKERTAANFLKLSLTAMIKSIKNKSRSYQKLMIYRLDTLLTLHFLVAIPL